MSLNPVPSHPNSLPRPPQPPPTKKSLMVPREFTVTDAARPKSSRFNKKRVIHAHYIPIKPVTLPPLERDTQCELKSNAISPTAPSQQYKQPNGNRASQSKKRPRSQQSNANDSNSNFITNPPKKRRKMNNDGDIWTTLIQNINECRSNLEEQHKTEIAKIIKLHKKELHEMKQQYKQSATERVQKEIHLLKSDNTKLRAGITKSVELGNTFQAQINELTAKNDKLTAELQQKNEEYEQKTNELNESLIAGHGIIKEMTAKKKEKENEWNAKKEKFEQTINEILTEKEEQRNKFKKQRNEWEKEKQNYEQRTQELKNQKGFDEIWEEHRRKMKKEI